MPMTSSSSHWSDQSKWFHLNSPPHGRSDETYLPLTTGGRAVFHKDRVRAGNSLANASKAQVLLWGRTSVMPPLHGMPTRLVSILVTAQLPLRLLCRPQLGCSVLLLTSGAEAYTKGYMKQKTYTEE